jgi:DNA polymerase-3 subunit epsilon
MTLRTALILDTETTGLDPKTDSCIEVGCILYDLEQAAPIASFASLIRCDRNPAWEVNRITINALDIAPDAGDVWLRAYEFASRADIIMAHRAEFDRGFVSPQVRDAKPWVCTKFHVDWPHGKPGDPLTFLALAHGVGIVNAHRAMSDCDTLSRLLSRVHEMTQTEEDPVPLVSLMQLAMRPRVKVQALVSYDDREKAKAAGFAWEASDKRWVREVAEQDAASFPFRTMVLT